MPNLKKLAAAVALGLSAAFPLHADPLHGPLAGTTPPGEARFVDGLLEIPFVGLAQEGANTDYFQVVLALQQSQGDLRFQLHNAQPVAPPAQDGAASFDLVQGMLRLPRIEVSGQFYLVALRQIAGGLDFSLDEAAPSLASSAHFRAAMSDLDRAFIGVLYITNTNAADAGSVQTARLMLRALQAEWLRFRQGYLGVGGADWQTYFSQIDADLATVAATLEQAAAGNGPQDLLAAHDALENLRNTLKALRAANGVDYFMDAVTALHHAMEGVLGTIKDVTGPADMNESVLGALLETFPVFYQALEQVLAADFDAAAQQYGLSAAKAMQIKQAAQAQRANVQALIQAYQNGDKPALLQSVQKIKPLFVKLFMGYGDFLAPFGQSMANMEKAYVPALFLTNIADADEARATQAGAALTAFREAWQAFGGHFSPTLQNILGWSGFFEQINTAVAEAEAALAGIGAYPADLTQAHAALEAVRQTLMQWRGLENLDYVMDHVTAYHNAMEPLVMLITAAAQAGDLSAEDLANLPGLVQTARSALQYMQQAIRNMPLADFGFDAAKHQQLQQSVQAQVGNLDQLQQALADADVGAALAAGQKVKPLFVTLFKQIGGLM